MVTILKLRRSAERIIIQLIEYEYFMLAEDKHPYQQGRLRKLAMATNK
ncbi:MULTISPECIES: hypothetical protein [unclassified Lysinibacillus]|nr:MULTISPECIES: hypothetical protein [unclassified Lysinibacillus]